MKKTIIPLILLTAYAFTGCSVSEETIDQLKKEVLSNNNTVSTEVTNENSDNYVVPEVSDSSIISNVGANTSVSGVISNVDDAVTPSTEAVIVRDFPFDRITFRSTFYGDVPSYYSEDGNWYSDRAGETLPFMDFVAQYIDASQIEVDFELQSGANADNVYIEFCDVFGNALYSCDYECTTFVVNESNTPSIYHNGVITDGVYELNVYINGVQYMNSSIYIYDSSTDHVMENDDGVVSDSSSIPTSQMNLLPAYREIVDCIKAQLISGNYTDIDYNHPGINYYVTNHDGSYDSIYVSSCDITGDGVDELFFMSESEDGVPYILEMYQMIDGEAVEFCATMNLVNYYIPNNQILVTNGVGNSLYVYWTANASGTGFHELYAIWASEERLPCATEVGDVYWYSATEYNGDDTCFLGTERPNIEWSPMYVPSTQYPISVA